MDLMGGYLLIMLVLFAGNIALLLGSYKLNNLKALAVSLMLSVITFVLINASGCLNISLLDYFSYIFLALSIFVFILMFLSTKKNHSEVLLYSVLIIFAFSAMLISSQTNLEFFSSILYSLLFFIILFVGYKLSKLLHHAKRQYSVIIGEYMCLFSILVFIFALTYESAKTLDYAAFSPFLILTPTYQLIYVVIGIIVVLVIGVLINDKGGNS
jgi:hypothetical protein